jgi:transposase-like protein
MGLIVEIDPPLAKGHTMTVRKLKAVPRRFEAPVAQDQDLLKALVKEALDQMLQAEMTQFPGAVPGERSEGRGGHRSGYCGRGLITRAGKIELRVTRDRRGEFSTARFQGSEKALVSALAGMYVQGVSTRNAASASGKARISAWTSPWQYVIVRSTLAVEQSCYCASTARDASWRT